jgi:hypothetical protein
MSLSERADAYRAGHRRAVVRDRRAQFEQRLADSALVCTCRQPGVIDPGELCTRCYESPGGPRHIAHALAAAVDRLASEEDR